jgi:predicted AlkP superfamily phosphohydrolase/phosphomutase
VIGLDGATFDIILPWIRKDALPTLRRLMKRGVYGNLISTIPPVTSPAWPSFMTGKNPGKHGVFDFVGRGKGYSKILKTSRDIKAKTLWKLLSDQGKTCIVVNVPLTYPPEKIRGCIVTGMLTPPGTCYAYPFEVYEELKKIGYELEIKNYEKYSSPKELLTYLVRIAFKRTKAVLHLMDKFSNWDFCMLVFRGTDVIQHNFWQHKDIIFQFYQKIDELIKDLINKARNETNIILMSDHGFGSAHKFFHVNYFLNYMGLLQLGGNYSLRGNYLDIKGYRHAKTSLWKIMLKMGITKERIHELAQKTNTLSILQKVSGKVKIEIPKTKRSIDWKRTKAFFSSSIGPSAAIEINLKGREPEGIVTKEEYHEIRELIIKELLEVKDPENGRSIVQDAFRREDIYYGPFLLDSPDIVFLTNNMEYIATDRIYGNNLVSEPFRKGRGTHRMNGILIAYGPDIKDGGEKIERARIIDLAPTILHMFELEIPEDMDGKVLIDIFHPSSQIVKKIIRYHRYTEREKIKEKIKNIKKKQFS